VRQTGTGLANDGDRVMCLAETFPTNLVIRMSGFTVVGGRDGARAGRGAQVFGGGAIIGGELNNSLTLTNMVFANNWTTGPGLGGAAVQITGGNLIITNSTFGGSSAPASIPIARRRARPMLRGRVAVVSRSRRPRRCIRAERAI
jgi:hypothetical protein